MMYVVDLVQFENASMVAKLVQFIILMLNL